MPYALPSCHLCVDWLGSSYSSFKTQVTFPFLWEAFPDSWVGGDASQPLHPAQHLLWAIVTGVRIPVFSAGDPETGPDLVAYVSSRFGLWLAQVLKTCLPNE